jgi:hypothetical protein
LFAAKAVGEVLQILGSRDDQEAREVRREVVEIEKPCGDVIMSGELKPEFLFVVLLARAVDEITRCNRQRRCQTINGSELADERAVTSVDEGNV